MRLGKYGKILHYDKTSLGIGNIKRFTIIEFKLIGGIIINIFNTKDQDRFHSHAFNAYSWMIKGYYDEEFIDDCGNHTFQTIIKSRFIPKEYIHKIRESSKNCISVTLEGPWDNKWLEIFDNGRVKAYNWGRKVIFDSKYEK